MDDSTEPTVVLHSKKKTTLELAAAALAAAAVGMIAVNQAGALDTEIFQRLLAAFGLDHLKASESTGTFVACVIGFAAAGFAEAAALYFVAGPPRFIASAMLIALSITFQWLIVGTTHAHSHPLGFLAALATGAAGGIYLRGLADKRRKEESTFYELKLKNRELLEMRLELLKQDEIERRILAADLHDQVLNDLKQVAHRFEKYCNEPDEENAEKIKVMTAQVMREIREVMDSLSPSVLEHLGLGAAIEDVLRRGSERSGFRTRFKNRVDNEDLDCLNMVEKNLLYRLVQESITNICKHAGASTVRATMETEDEELVIRVIDDGKGIDPAMARGDSRGLKYMRYRGDLIRATIAWKPGENGKGTTVEIRTNLADRRNAQAAAQQREKTQV